MGRKPTTKPRKRDEKVLYDWAARLYPYLQDEGIKSLTMNRAAQILDKSKSTIYEYLRSKEDILELIVDYKLTELYTYKNCLNDSSSPYAQRLENAISLIIERIGGLSNLFLIELHQYYPEQWSKVRLFLKEAIEVLDKYYEEGVFNGTFRPFDIALMTWMDQVIISQLLDARQLEENGLTFGKALDEYLKIKLYGITFSDP
jgi:AcrR family transcriptional regulator